MLSLHIGTRIYGSKGQSFIYLILKNWIKNKIFTLLIPFFSLNRAGQELGLEPIHSYALPCDVEGESSILFSKRKHHDPKILFGAINKLFVLTPWVKKY